MVKCYSVLEKPLNAAESQKKTPSNLKLLSGSMAQTIFNTVMVLRHDFNVQTSTFVRNNFLQ
jgi:hypothetical protein